MSRPRTTQLTDSLELEQNIRNNIIIRLAALRSNSEDSRRDNKINSLMNMVNTGSDLQEVNTFFEFEDLHDRIYALSLEPNYNERINFINYLRKEAESTYTLNAEVFLKHKINLGRLLTVLCTIDGSIKEIFKSITNSRSCKFPQIENTFKNKLLKYYEKDFLSILQIKSELNELDKDYHLLTIAIDKFFTLVHSNLAEDKRLQTKIHHLIINACSCAELDFKKMLRNMDYIYEDIQPLVKLAKDFNKKNDPTVLLSDERTLCFQKMKNCIASALNNKSDQLVEFNKPFYDDAKLIRQIKKDDTNKFNELNKLFDNFCKFDDELTKLCQPRTRFNESNLKINADAVYKITHLLLKENIPDNFKTALRAYVQKNRDNYAKQFYKKHFFYWISPWHIKHSPVSILDGCLKDLIVVKPKFSLKIKIGWLAAFLLMAGIFIAAVVVLGSGMVSVGGLPFLMSGVLIAGAIMVVGSPHGKLSSRKTKLDRGTYQSVKHVLQEYPVTNPAPLLKVDCVPTEAVILRSALFRDEGSPSIATIMNKRRL